MSKRKNKTVKYSVEEYREAIRKQGLELGAQFRRFKVHCANCNHLVFVYSGCRCLQCGLWFCKKCGEIHFK